MVKQSSKPHSNFLGSGWSFPITFSGANAQLITTSLAENINQSIKIILKTKQGERILESQFGSGLHHFCFRKMDETLKGEIADDVKMSLLHNEPRIIVKNVSIEYTDIKEGWVEVTITYVLIQTNTRHNYVYPFHSKEGTNLGL